MSALAFFGHRHTTIEPLELTVRFSRPLGLPSYMVCGLGNDGEPEVMFQGEFHPTIESARASAWAFAERAQGQMPVHYRSDKES